MKEPISFWVWFFCGPKRNFFSGGFFLIMWRWWTLLHVVVGAISAYFFDAVQYKEILADYTLPSAAIIFALSVSWANTATSLIRSKEIRTIIGDDIEKYIYGYQTAFLIIFCVIIFSAFYLFMLSNCSPENYKFLMFLSAVVFFLVSLSIQQSWRVIQFTIVLTQADHYLIKQKEDLDNNNP